jgi:hypothetical protein
MADETDPPREETPAASGSEFAGAPEISRRVASILDAVEREAERLREEAREEAAGYLEQAKLRADGLVAERQRRIAAVSDELLIKAEAVVGRLEDAAPVRDGFENLVRALGDAAERLSRETQTNGKFEPEPFHEVTARATPREVPAPVPAPEPPPAGTPAPARPSGFAQPHPARAASPRPSPPAAVPAAPANGGGEHRAADTSGWRQIDDARMVAIQMATTGATRAGVREHLKGALGVTDTAAILDEVFGAGTGEDAQVPWTAGPR